MHKTFDNELIDTCAGDDGYAVAKTLRANQHGSLVARCARGPTPHELGTRRGSCWGMLRWHGTASDGAILCEGHFAEADGEGYRSPPSYAQVDS